MQIMVPTGSDNQGSDLREAVNGLLAAIDRAARLSGRAAEHPEALSIRAEAERVRAALEAERPGGDA